MACHEQSQVETEAEEDEPVLIFRMIRVGDDLCSFVCKDRLCLDKVNAVLLEVRGSFGGIPPEAKFVHATSITTM